MLRAAKLLALKVARPAASFVLSSAWRRERLLILCYHGVSLEDEHVGLPELYVSPAQFRRRLERLREMRCSVLPLDEAVHRLYAGTLPERSVAITFDDGFHDFAAVASPILRDFSWPVTVYLTTYYSERPWPVFDPMIDYLLWKGAGRTLEWTDVVGTSLVLDQPGRLAAKDALRKYALARGLSGEAKNQLLSQLARRIGIDFERIVARGIMRIMNSDEVRRVSREGADIQLHTHRHRVFRRPDRFGQEIDENRCRIEALTGREAVHFCYPGGFSLAEFPAWLRERGVRSATTCLAGMATRQSDPMLLPRLLDASDLSEIEFESWVTGLAHLLPQRAYAADPMQLLEESA